MIHRLEESGTDVTNQPLSRKQTIITELYALCKNRGNLVFDNTEVRTVCNRLGFSNQFDATKLDNSAALPQELVDDDAFVVHLGRGRHQFVFGIAVGYHEFEGIPEERRYQWPYRRSILNNINTSESNILSVGYNQRVIHDFLYDDIGAAPMIYFSNLAHIPLDCWIGSDEINATGVRVKLDFAAERLGTITVFAASNGEPPDFNVFQLFNPYRYYLKLGADRDIQTDTINGCYLLQHENRLRLYLYTFVDAHDPGSIQLLRNAEYTLVQR